MKDIYFCTEEIAAVHFDLSKGFVPQDTVTNVFLATFTTAWARIKLYGEMDKLGEAVLYHDTDSIIYASDGVNDPPLGNFLGEFTDELDGDIITTFVSGNYCLKICFSKPYVLKKLVLSFFPILFRWSKELFVQDRERKNPM